MPLHPEPLSPELPYPPAVSRREPLPLPADSDPAFFPPFSRRGGAAVAASPPPAVAVQAGAAPSLPVPAEPAPLPAAPDPDQALANEVAGRLESMAEDLRRLGFHALLQPRSEREPIDAVLAAVIAGFLARR